MAFLTRIFLILSAWVLIFLIPLAKQEHFCCNDSKHRKDEEALC